MKHRVNEGSALRTSVVGILAVDFDQKIDIHMLELAKSFNTKSNRRRVVYCER